MEKTFKIFSFLLIFIFQLIFLSNEIYASEEFEIESITSYTVTAAGLAQVQHDIKLTNKKPDIFPSEYSLSLASTRLENVWAKDLTGYLTPKTEVKDNLTTIKIEFRQKSVGIGQALLFSVGYQDNDISQKIGRIWETNIPTPSDLEKFTNYTISLLVPLEFEESLQIFPKPSVSTIHQDHRFFEFKKEDLNNRGITAIFGEKQVFAFDLRYSLKNPTPVKKSAQIALPPDTLYQKVLYDAIIPNPEGIILDQDGNWLANYELGANETLEIHAIGSVIISLKPFIEAFSNVIPTEDYLKEQESWQSNDPQIISLAQQLKTPENIYNYVLSTLEYNYERIKEGSIRLGALGALANPQQAICMEFTDLFIALSRAAGIPAREINGYAFTQNQLLRPLSLKQDILHAWAEYYDIDKKIWIQVDPTWGDTTNGIDYFSRFDLNHFAFVIHGTNSKTPYPAGFYKLDESQGKDIIIDPRNILPEIRENLDVELVKPQPFVSGWKNRYLIKIKNNGNVSSPKKNLIFTSKDFDILSNAEYELHPILPYSYSKIPVELKTTKLFENKIGLLNIRIDDTDYEKQFKIYPIYIKFPKIILSLAIGASFAKISLKTGRLLLSLFKRRSFLHRKST